MYLYESTVIGINNQLGKEVREEKTRFAKQCNAKDSVKKGAALHFQEEQHKKVSRGRQELSRG